MGTAFKEGTGEIFAANNNRDLLVLLAKERIDCYVEDTLVTPVGPETDADKWRV